MSLQAAPAGAYQWTSAPTAPRETYTPAKDQEKPVDKKKGPRADKKAETPAPDQTPPEVKKTEGMIKGTASTDAKVEAAIDSGRALFDGSKPAGGAVKIGGSLSGKEQSGGSSSAGPGSASSAGSSGPSASPPAAPEAEELPPQLRISVGPSVRPVPEIQGSAVQATPPPADSASWLDDWAGAVRRGAGAVWDGIKEGVESLTQKTKDMLSRMGDWFRDAFMKVWNAPETASTGKVNNGGLINGIQMPKGLSAIADVRNFNETYGTKHMILGLMYIAAQINQEGGPKLKIGDVSDKHGGKLGGHKSHQQGNDVDIYFNEGGQKAAYWNYRILHHLCNNPFMTPTMIFVSSGKKSSLLGQAKAAGDGQVASWAGGVLNTNEPGHDNHYHVRIDPKPKSLPKL